MNIEDHFAQLHRRARSLRWKVIALQIAVLVPFGFCVGWLLGHPEAIGDYFGRIAVGFYEATAS